jgi:hypothetical protein
MADSKQRSKSNSQAAARRKSASRSGKSGTSAKSTSSSNAPDPTKGASPVAARAQLNENIVARDQLERQAAEQEKQQARALRDGVASGAAKKAHDERHKIGKENRAALRQPRRQGDAPLGPTGGLVDQTTARPGDALQGHFVRIDLDHDGVPDRLRENGRDHGVYIEPAELDENGYPLLAQVRLRDETNELVTVPYEALSPSERRGR